MKQLSVRDIHMFIGGAFALMGFQAVIPLFMALIGPYEPSLFAIWLVLLFLTLPIGIGILVGRHGALRCATAYLWLCVIAGCVVVPAFYLINPENAGNILLASASTLFSSAILLGLILWSRTSRFKNKPAE